MLNHFFIVWDLITFIIILHVLDPGRLNSGKPFPVHKLPRPTKFLFGFFGITIFKTLHDSILSQSYESPGIDKFHTAISKWNFSSVFKMKPSFPLSASTRVTLPIILFEAHLPFLCTSRAWRMNMMILFSDCIQHALRRDFFPLKDSDRLLCPNFELFFRLLRSFFSVLSGLLENTSNIFFIGFFTYPAISCSTENFFILFSLH